MADLIQGLGLLEKFSIIFPFLLTLVLVYAVLLKTKILGENKGILGTIALAIAVIVLFSPGIIKMINLMAPWFVILVIFTIFLLLVIMALGVSEGDVLAIVKGKEYGGTIVMWVIALSLIIGFGSLSFVGFGTGEVGEVPEGEIAEDGSPGTVAAKGESAFWAVLTHPKVLGLALILLIAFFTLNRLARY